MVQVDVAVKQNSNTEICGNKLLLIFGNVIDTKLGTCRQVSKNILELFLEKVVRGQCCSELKHLNLKVHSLLHVSTFAFSVETT